METPDVIFQIEFKVSDSLSFFFLDNEKQSYWLRYYYKGLAGRTA